MDDDVKTGVSYAVPLIRCAAHCTSFKLIQYNDDILFDGSQNRVDLRLKQGAVVVAPIIKYPGTEIGCADVNPEY